MELGHKRGMVAIDSRRILIIVKKKTLNIYALYWQIKTIIARK